MTTLTPYEAGAAARAAGIPHDGHGKQPGDPTIDPWQQGWRDERDRKAQEQYDRFMKPQADIVRSTPKASTSRAAQEFMASLFAMVLP